MPENTKICKHCQSEIPKKAKICPVCRKKQGRSKVLLILGVIFIISGLFIIMGGSEEEFKTDYTQEEVVTYEGVNYSIIKVEKTQGNNEFWKPKEGKEFVKVTIKIENNSDDKISYNTLDWQMVNADGVEDSFGTFTADENDDEMLSSGELEPKGKVEGALVWEQKIGDDNLRLRYYDNMFNSDYTFQFKLK
jgi:hypothetical protein